MTAEAKAFLWLVALLLCLAGVSVLQARHMARIQAETAGVHRATETKATRSKTATGRASAQALIIPVDGVKASDLVDTWAAMRSEGRTHKGIDIMAPAGTAVRAAAPGKIAKLFFSKRGGITIYEIDDTGRYIYYYAHLQGYESGLVEGATIAQGDRIGFVGQTGNATVPHLHFEIENAPADGKWWRGDSFNPYPSLKAGAVIAPADQN